MVTSGSLSRVTVEPLVLDYLARGMAVEFEVSGGSMAPFIRDHDVVAVVPIDRDDVGIGDIVVWSRGDRLVVHRVVSYGGGSVKTRGDAVGFLDEYIGIERLVGRVARISRDGSASKRGLGPERRVLGWLSRVGLLQKTLGLASMVRSRVFNREAD